jgi:hypothetical protein
MWYKQRRKSIVYLSVCVCPIHRPGVLLDRVTQSAVVGSQVLGFLANDHDERDKTERRRRDTTTMSKTRHEAVQTGKNTRTGLRNHLEGPRPVRGRGNIMGSAQHRLPGNKN